MARFMPRFVTSRVVIVVGAIALAASAALAVETRSALAQGQSHPLQPGEPGIPRIEKRLGVIEGKLTRVDGRSESVDVSIGFLGLLGKTLEVDRATLIEVNGREASFADLQEGAKVKAFYVERGAKLVATRLEVSTGAQRAGG